MDASDQAELEKLRAELARCREATVAWRESLVESLGDRLCGAGPGPSTDDIDTLISLVVREQEASDAYELFLISLAFKPGRQLR